MRHLAPARKLIAAFLFSSLTTGCTTTSVERRTVASPAQVRLVRGEAPALSGAFRHVPEAIVGQVSLTKACRQEQTQEVRTQDYAVIKPNRPALGGAIVLGAGLGMLGAWAISTAGDREDTDRTYCNGMSGECKSGREGRIELGAMLVGAAVGTIALAVQTLNSKPQEHEQGKAEVEKQTRTLDAEASCGSPGAVEGLSLSVSLPDGTITTGLVDAAGSVRLPLPRELPPSREPLPVHVTVVPEGLRDRVTPGAQVGEVMLVAMKAPAVRGSARRKTR